MIGPDANHKGPQRKLPSAVVALGVTSFFTDIGSEMIFPLLPVFVASLGGGTTYLGLVEGLANATANMLKLWSGYAADRMRVYKPMVIAGYGIAALVRPLMAIATAPWHVLAVRVTDRVGKGIRSSPRDVLIASSVDSSESGRAFGFHRAMDHAGAVVGPLIATALLGLGVSMRDVFWCALVPGVLALVVVSSVREPKQTLPATAPEPARREDPTAQERLSGSLRMYLAILGLFALGNSSEAFLLLRANELGVPVASLPLVWTVFHVSKVLSSYLGGDMSDRVPRTKLIVAGWTIYAVTYVLFGVATETWHAWLLFVVFGSYYGLTEPTERAMMRDLAPLHLRGRAYGYYNFILGMCAIPAGLLTGYLWQTWGSMVALGTGAAIAVTASVALIAWSQAPDSRTRTSDS